MPRSQQIDLASLSLIEFNAHVADPARYSGGGSVSAAAAASAASLTLLVLTLNLRHKRNQDGRDQIDADISRVRKLHNEFIDLVSRDAEVLSRLMESHQSRNGDSNSEYRSALLEAVSAPLELAEKCVLLLAIIKVNAPQATRFTVADLGAAASISAAAANSSLLMTDINKTMLAELPDPPISELEDIEERRASVLATVDKVLYDVLDVVRSKLAPRRETMREKTS